MGTLLRVDPPGGCFASPRSGDARRRRAQERHGHRARRPTTAATTRSTRRRRPARPATTAGADDDHGRLGRRLPDVPAAYYVRVDNEVLQVTGGQGTTTWTVARGQLGTRGGDPRQRTPTVTALATDWYAGFTGVAGRRRRTSR